MCWVCDVLSNIRDAKTRGWKRWIWDLKTKRSLNFSSWLTRTTEVRLMKRSLLKHFIPKNIVSCAPPAATVEVSFFVWLVFFESLGIFARAWNLVRRIEVSKKKDVAEDEFILGCCGKCSFVATVIRGSGWSRMERDGARAFCAIGSDRNQTIERPKNQSDFFRCADFSRGSFTPRLIAETEKRQRETATWKNLPCRMIGIPSAHGSISGSQYASYDFHLIPWFHFCILKLCDSLRYNMQKPQHDFGNNTSQAERQQREAEEAARQVWDSHVSDFIILSDSEFII